MESFVPYLPHQRAGRETAVNQWPLDGKQWVAKWRPDATGLMWRAAWRLLREEKFVLASASDEVEIAGTQVCLANPFQRDRIVRVRSDNGITANIGRTRHERSKRREYGVINFDRIRAGGKVFNRVFAEAGCEHENVVTASTSQRIIPCPPHQHVVFV